MYINILYNINKVKFDYILNKEKNKLITKALF